MRINILAFALGVGWLQMQQSLPEFPDLLGALTGAALLLCLGSFRQRVGGAPRAVKAVRTVSAVSVMNALACLILGATWAAWLAGQRLQHSLPAEWEGRDLQVVGIVAALPNDFERGQRFEFVVESLQAGHQLAAARTAAPGESLPQRIMLSWYHGRLDEEWPEALMIRPGERWRFTVRLKRPHGNANPDGFDYEAWLLERGLRATGYVRPRSGERLDAFVWRPAYVIERWRESIRRSFYAVLPEAPDAGILVALAIGDQQAIAAAQWRVFRQTGVTHLMSTLMRL